MASGGFGFQSNIPRISGIRPPSSVGPSRSRSQSTRSVNGPLVPSTLKRSSSFGVRSRSSSTGRSVGGSSIVSRFSIAGRSTARASIKDNRPLQTKEFKKECSDKLKDFLLRQHYDKSVQPITNKLLQGPSNKEFYTMFEFLYQCLSPDFKLSKNPVDEIPVIIRNLGYPYNINRSHLMNPGSRQSWCHLLPFLSWMVTIIRYAEHYRPTVRKDQYEQYAEADYEDMSGSSLLEILYKYAGESFLQVVQGHHISKNGQTERVRNLVELYTGLSEDEMAEARQKREKLLQDLTRTQDDLHILNGVEQSIGAFQKDIEVFTHYNQEISQKILEKKKYQEHFKKANDELRMKLEAKKERNKDLRRRIDEQGAKGLNARVQQEKMRVFQLEVAHWEQKLKSRKEKKWTWEMEQLATHGKFKEACSLLEDLRIQLVGVMEAKPKLFSTFPQKPQLDQFARFDRLTGDARYSSEIIAMLRGLPALFFSLTNHFAQEGVCKVEEALRNESAIISDLDGQAKLIEIETRDLEDFVNITKKHTETENAKMQSELETIQSNVRALRVELLQISQPSKQLTQLEEDVRHREKKFRRVEEEREKMETHFRALIDQEIGQKETRQNELDLVYYNLLGEFDRMSEALWKFAQE